MASENAMTSKKTKLQYQYAHGNELEHVKGFKEKVLTTTAGIIATGVVFICFIALAGLSL